MQYLLKVALPGTMLWRLLAIDGIADRAFAAQLIALGFGYPDAPRAFIVAGRTLPAGCAGTAQAPEELMPFDELQLAQGALFGYQHDRASPTVHEVSILKAAEHLYCLMPSCLVGSGHVAEGLEITAEAVNAYLDRDDCPSLNLREVTLRMRTYGVRRDDAHAALLGAGAAPLKFKTH